MAPLAVSIALLCPSCGSPATLHRAPVSLCPNCQTPWPEALRLSAEASLGRQKVMRPLLLTLALYTAPAFGGFVLLLLFLAPFNAANYSINGERVTGSEFLERAGVLLGILGVSSLAGAYAIWREYPWSRWAIVAFWVAQVAGAIGFGWADSGIGGAAGAVASLLTLLVLVGWYLFGKENVVEYYQGLEKDAAARAARLRAHRTDRA